MATVLPPLSKKTKLARLEETDLSKLPDINIRFQDGASDFNTSDFRLSASVTNKELQLLLNKVLENDENVSYGFSAKLKDDRVIDIGNDIYLDLLKPGLVTAEDSITIVYSPEAIFTVRSVSRCTGNMKGHDGVVLSAQFSPNSSTHLVTGSGDFTARIWDTQTHTPIYKLEGHKNWVLCVSYSPDAKLIATGSMDNTIRLWDAETGKAIGNAMMAHTKWITGLVWEPIHLCKTKSIRLASSSKDKTIRLWNTSRRTVVMSFSGHTSAVTCIKWGGNGWIYSASQDKTIKVWNADDGSLISTLTAHAHWVNHLALSTDFVLRTGAFDHTGHVPSTFEEMQERARKRYAAVLADQKTELLVSASDDLTMYLWNPEKGSKPVIRLHGHNKAVNHVSFSPDGKLIASASFDNQVKIWNGKDGTFIASLIGHVGPVYQCSWSADSRLIASASKDTTLKVWDIRRKKLFADLPGHDEEVYAVDWSPDGQCVASGGKDRAVRVWRH